MAFNVSYIYQIKDKYSATANRIKAKNAAIGKSFDSLRAKVSKLSKKFSSLGKGLSLKVTAPILAIAGFALKSAADIETLGVAFESMTRSAKQSAIVVKGLISFAAKTPFQLIGIGKAAKQLLAAGVTVENLQGKLKFLGDISAGANVPLSDMASIFAKAKAKGKAMTEELLQLSDRGIPIISVLSKQLGVAKDEVFELASKSRISFSVLEKAMVSMSATGGVFADQMKKQSNTLAGVWSTLKDNVNLALASLGAQIAETFDLKNTINSVISIIQKVTAVFVKFTKENPRLAKLAIIILAVAAAVGPLLIGMGVLLALVGPAIAGFTAVSAIIATVGPALLTAAAGAAIFGAIAAPVFVVIAVAIAGLIKHWDTLKQAMQNIMEFWSGAFLIGLGVVSDTIKEIIGLVSSVFGLSTDAVAIDVRTQQRDTEREKILSRLRGPSVASQTLTNNARLDGEININAPSGVVNNVKSSMTGANIGGLGLNLAGAS